MSYISLISLSVAMLVLAAIPGPGVFATVARSLSSGFRPALAVIAGIVVVHIFFLIFAIFGLSIIAKALGEFFPEHDQWVQELIPRIVDLYEPFRNFYYYNPLQKGSASIKKILPALTGKSYENLDIADGGSANMEFLKMSFGNLEEKEKKKIKKDLEKYCKLDTEGMIWIVDKLNKIKN